MEGNIFHLKIIANEGREVRGRKGNEERGEREVRRRKEGRSSPKLFVVLQLLDHGCWEEGRGEGENEGKGKGREGKERRKGKGRREGGTLVFQIITVVGDLRFSWEETNQI